MKSDFTLLITVFFIITLNNAGFAQTTVTDIDGNVYNTIQIGTQLWMQENLKTAHYRNGDSINEIEDGLPGEICKTPAIQWRLGVIGTVIPLTMQCMASYTIGTQYTIPEILRQWGGMCPTAPNWSL